MSIFFIELAQLKQGKVFDALVPGSFKDMFGRKFSFKKTEMKTYLKNTLAAIAATTTESGEVVGLPIDAHGHDKGDGAGWIVDAKLEDNTIRLIPKWTKIGQDLISGGIRRMFSPTVDVQQKVIVGGSLTNWPATVDKKGKVLLRPIEMEKQNTDDPYLWIVNEDYEFETTPDAELTESLNEKSSAVRSAFREQFLPKEEKELEMSPWVIDVFEDHAIVNEGQKYFSAPFTKDDKGKIKFSKKSEWKEVKKSWVEAALEQVREAINLFRAQFKTVYRVDKLNSNTEVFEMEMTKEELATLVSDQVTAALAEVKKGVIADLSDPSSSSADDPKTDPKTDPAVQSAALLAAFGMENVSEDFTKAVKEQLVEAYDRQKAMLVQQSAEMVAGIRREAHVADFVKNVVSGTEENPRGIAVEPKALQDFIMGLDPDEARFAQEMITKIVNGTGLIEFEELGNQKPVEGTVELPDVVKNKLETGEMKIADLSSPILGLGDLSQYNLEKWREKSDA